MKTFDANDFTAEVTLRAAGQEPTVHTVDLYLFNQHWWRHTKDVDWDALNGIEQIFPLYAAAVASFFGVPVERVPGSMAWHAVRYLIDKFHEVKKKMSDDEKPTSPPSTASTSSSAGPNTAPPSGSTETRPPTSDSGSPTT